MQMEMMMMMMMMMICDRLYMWVMEMMTMVVAMSCARVLLAVDSVAVDEYL